MLRHGLVLINGWWVTGVSTSAHFIPCSIWDAVNAPVATVDHSIIKRGTEKGLGDKIFSYTVGRRLETSRKHQV